MRSRVLVVARDVALRAGLARLLRGAGHSIELAENAAHARRLGADLKSVDFVLVAPERLGHEGNMLAAELQASSKPRLF